MYGVHCIHYTCAVETLQSTFWREVAALLKASLSCAASLCSTRTHQEKFSLTCEQHDRGVQLSRIHTASLSTSQGYIPGGFSLPGRVDLPKYYPPLTMGAHKNTDTGIYIYIYIHVYTICIYTLTGIAYNISTRV